MNRSPFWVALVTVLQHEGKDKPKVICSVVLLDYKLLMPKILLSSSGGKKKKRFKSGKLPVI